MPFVDIEDVPATVRAPAIFKHVPKFYETIKMRYLLAASTREQGMEVHHGKYMAFYDGMSLWLPNTYTINTMYTDVWLDQNPHYKWKYVIIWKTALTWSQFIKKNNITGISKIVQGIPFVGGLLAANISSWSEVAELEESLNSMTAYPVWDNLGYKHTVANEVLQANYGKVLSDLEPYLLKRYGGEME